MAKDKDEELIKHDKPGAPSLDAYSRETERAKSDKKADVYGVKGLVKDRIAALQAKEKEFAKGKSLSNKQKEPAEVAPVVEVLRQQEQQEAPPEVEIVIQKEPKTFVPKLNIIKTPTDTTTEVAKAFEQEAASFIKARGGVIASDVSKTDSSTARHCTDAATYQVTGNATIPKFVSISHDSSEVYTKNEGDVNDIQDAIKLYFDAAKELLKGMNKSPEELRVLQEKLDEEQKRFMGALDEIATKNLGDMFKKPGHKVSFNCFLLVKDATKTVASKLGKKFGGETGFVRDEKGNAKRKIKEIGTKEIIHQVFPALTEFLRKATDSKDLKATAGQDLADKLKTKAIELHNTTERPLMAVTYTLPALGSKGEPTHIMELCQRASGTGSSLDRSGSTGVLINAATETTIQVDSDGEELSRKRIERSGSANIIDKKMKIKDRRERIQKAKELIREEFSRYYFENINNALIKAKESGEKLTPERIKEIITECGKVTVFRQGLMSDHAEEYGYIKEAAMAYKEIAMETAIANKRDTGEKLSQQEEKLLEKIGGQGAIRPIGLGQKQMEELMAIHTDLNLNKDILKQKMSTTKTIFMNFGANLVRGLSTSHNLMKGNLWALRHQFMGKQQLQTELNKKANEELFAILKTRLSEYKGNDSNLLKARGLIKSLDGKLNEAYWKEIRTDVVAQLDKFEVNKLNNPNDPDTKLFKTLSLFVAHCDRNLATQIPPLSLSYPMLSSIARPDLAHLSYTAQFDARYSMETYNNFVRQAIALTFADELLDASTGNNRVATGCKSGKDRTASMIAMCKIVQCRLASDPEAFKAMNNKETELEFLKSLWAEFPYVMQRTVSREIQRENSPGASGSCDQSQGDDWHRQAIYPEDIAERCMFSKNQAYTKLHKAVTKGFKHFKANESGISSPKKFKEIVMSLRTGMLKSLQTVSNSAPHAILSSFVGKAKGDGFGKLKEDTEKQKEGAVVTQEGQPKLDDNPPRHLEV